MKNFKQFMLESADKKIVSAIENVQELKETIDEYFSDDFRFHFIRTKPAEGQDKTRNNFKIKFKSNDPNVSVEQVAKTILLKGGKQVRECILVKVRNGKLDNGLKKIEIEVYGNDELIETIKTKFIGPLL